MASFQHPLQCLQYAQQQSVTSAGILVASSGRSIYSYAVDNGKCLDVWPKNIQSNAEHAADEQAPPEKKIKLSPGSDGQDEQLKEKSSSKKAPGKQSPEWTNIPILLTSFDGKHVIALTAEDKTIRVFSLSQEGQLEELSSRTMPKRPSALALTPDGQNILCGDKFGDAYSLPLFPGEYVRRVEDSRATKIAATNRTVHSQRNLHSLEQQRIHAEKTAEKAAKGEDSVDNTARDFEHQLILGHVSLLTDLISVSLPTGGSNRSYILTADRDEHIRVSRGVPQSHVIEKYCLGHTAFINKLCVPSWAPQYLISGGGDNFLLLWKWSEGQPLQKVSLEGVTQTPEVNVRGIWAVSAEQSTGAPAQAILVGLEGSSTLLSYTMEGDALKQQESIQLSGNILDVTGLDSHGAIIVSVDNVREPGSTEIWKSSPSTPQILLESFQATTKEGSLKWNPTTDDVFVTAINAAGTSPIPTDADDKQKKTLDGALYSMSVLRKRQHED